VKKIQMYAFPNARFLIEDIGLGQAIMLVIAEYEHLYFVKNPRTTMARGSTGRSRKLKETTVTICRNIPIAPDKEITANLLYDLHERTFKGQITGRDWRIDESQIKFKNLPATLAIAYVGKTVDKLCDLEHLKTRKILQHIQKNNKGFREFLILDEPEKYEIEQGKWKNG